MQADTKTGYFTYSEKAYEVGNININGEGTALYENIGYAEARNILSKILPENPDKVLPMLEQYFSVPFADSLVVAAAHRNPNQLYDYAAATRTNGKIDQEK